jgi:hypothetical protein
MKAVTPPQSPKKKNLSGTLTALLTALFFTALSTPHLHARELAPKAQEIAQNLEKSGVKMEVNEAGQPVFVTKNVVLTLTTGRTDWSCGESTTDETTPPTGNGPL